MEDRNFDDLVERFANNIYRSLKGKIRFAVLRQDLAEMVPELRQSDAVKVLDAGGGLGAFAVDIAAQGHQVVYCDISEKMLAEAQSQAVSMGVSENIEFRHQAVQRLLQKDNDFQVILFHAVLEWLAQPRQVLNQLLNAMQPGTKLSLLFYNQQSIVFRNLLRGNFFRATAENHAGGKGSLTPMHPLNPDDVRAWVLAHNVDIVLESGVRVFSDYAEKQRLAQRSEEQIITTELAFSRQEPYRALGRYYHMMIVKKP